LVQVANGLNPEDFGLVAGVRNSHDKSFPASLVLGASMFVCDNLSFSGEVKKSVFLEAPPPLFQFFLVGRPTAGRLAPHAPIFGVPVTGAIAPIDVTEEAADGTV
jgi:hypothetical protein